jgi:GntR family transcriptional regulator
MSDLRDGGSHLYKRLAETLEDRIRNGTYPVGTLLPSQNDLVREFDVSRPTVIEALRVLKLQGLIETQPGRGSLVSRSREEGVKAPLRLYRVIEGGEQDGGTDLLMAGVAAAPSRVRGYLMLTDTKMFLRQYVRFAPNAPEEPIELVSLWIPLTLATVRDFGSAAPLDKGVRQLLEDHSTLELEWAREQISARSASENESIALKIETGAPVLEIFTSLGTNYPMPAPLMAIELVMPGDKGTLTTDYVVNLCPITEPDRFLQYHHLT